MCAAHRRCRVLLDAVPAMRNRHESDEEVTSKDKYKLEPNKEAEKQSNKPVLRAHRQHACKCNYATCMHASRSMGCLHPPPQSYCSMR